MCQREENKMTTIFFTTLLVLVSSFHIEAEPVWPDLEARYAHCELVPGAVATLSGQVEIRIVYDSGMIEVKINITGVDLAEGWYAQGISIRQFGDTSNHCLNMGEPWYRETPTEISAITWEHGKLFEDKDSNLLFVFPNDFDVLRTGDDIIGRGLVILDTSLDDEPETVLGCCTLAESDSRHWHDNSKGLVRAFGNLQ